MTKNNVSIIKWRLLTVCEYCHFLTSKKSTTDSIICSNPLYLNCTEWLSICHVTTFSDTSSIYLWTKFWFRAINVSNHVLMITARYQNNKTNDQAILRNEQVWLDLGAGIKILNRESHYHTKKFWCSLQQIILCTLQIHNYVSVCMCTVWQWLSVLEKITSLYSPDKLLLLVLILWK